jgi:hypothetical protein
VCAILFPSPLSHTPHTTLPLRKFSLTQPPKKASPEWKATFLTGPSRDIMSREISNVSKSFGEKDGELLASAGSKTASRAERTTLCGGSASPKECVWGPGAAIEARAQRTAPMSRVGCNSCCLPWWS